MNAENKITFQSFTERVAKRANVSGVEADAYIHQLSKTVGDVLEKGDEVQLYRFGRFHTTHVDERSGHNPKTGEALTIPEHTRVDFQPYKALLLAVNWPFRHLRTRMLPQKETFTRSTVITWVILALALLALIFVLINENTQMFNRNSVTAPPAEVPANIEPEQPAIQAAPVVTPAVTDTATAAPLEPITVTNVALIESIAATNIVVAPGDTLWEIAASQWGDPSWWPVIYAENRPNLAARNPDLIEAGSSVRIPVLAGGVAQPTDADLRLKSKAYRIVADDYAQLGHPRAAEYRLLVNRRFSSL